MPLTIKSGLMKYKDPDSGEYVGINAISDETTAEQIAEIQAAGAAQKTAVQNKGTEVINSIPADYTALSNEVSAQKSAFERSTGITNLSFIPGYYAATNIGDTATFTSSSSYVSAISACTKDNFVRAKAGGASGARAYAYLDNDYKVLEICDAWVNIEGELHVPPEDTAYVVVNNRLATYGTGYYASIGKYPIDKYDEFSDLINQEAQFTGGVPLVFRRGYIDCSGSVIDFNDVIDSDSWIYTVVPCEKDDVFIITANSSNKGRAWCFIDDEGNKLTCASSSGNYKLYRAVATHDDSAYFISCRNKSLDNGCAFKIVDSVFYNMNNELWDEVNSTKSALGTVPSGKTAQGQITDNASDIADLKSAFERSTGITYLSFIPGYYAATNIGDTATFTSSSSYVSAISACTKDNFVRAKAGGASGARAYAYLDNDYKVLEICDAWADVDGELPVPPEDTAFVVVNNRLATYGTGYYASIGKYPIDKYDEFTDLINQEAQFTGGVPLVFRRGYIDCSGSVIDFNDVIDSDSWIYTVVPCEKDDVFIVTANSSNKGRAWCFIDDEGNKLACASSSGDYKLFRAVATHDDSAYFISCRNKSLDNGCAVKIVDSVVYDMIKSNPQELIKNTTGWESFEFKSGYITTNAETVDISDINRSSTWEYAVVSCVTDDIFLVNGSGGESAYLWTFIDNEGNVLSHSVSSDETGNKYSMIKAPNYAEKLIINAHTAIRHDVRKIIDSEAFFNYYYDRFSKDDIMYGRYNSSLEYVDTAVFVCTPKYIPDTVKGFIVNSSGVKVAVGMHNKINDSVDRRYWFTEGDTYVFNHARYDYVMWIGNETETALGDWDELLSKISIICSKGWYLDNIRLLKDKNQSQRNDINLLEASIYNMRLNMPYNISFANAVRPLSLVSYVGDTQNVHPSVEYFQNGFGGHKFWMAYTPYTEGQNYVENPCIAYSDDGISWTNIPGNPIDTPASGNYDSDTELVYNQSTSKLECWFRQVVGHETEIIYRMTSSDGATWSAKEAVLTNESGNYSSYLSPAVIINDNKYCMWVVKHGTNPSIDYYESPTNEWNWQNIRSITITFASGYKPWHLDVIKDNSQYVLIAMTRTGSTAIDLYEQVLATSSDNITYSTPQTVIKGCKGGWDEKIYRASIVKVGNKYRIYYSALDGKGTSEQASQGATWGMGITESDSLGNFVGMLY